MCSPEGVGSRRTLKEDKVRWEAQEVGRSPAALFGDDVVVRHFDTPRFRGITFYEVRARSVLNKVPDSSRMPFGWTINPYRGCSHACVYCFARNTHTYLDLDPGADFNSQIVVKVNAVERLRRELAAPSWEREHVSMGTNVDCYQRAEGHYRLMPGIIEALADSGTPFSILTKGTLLRRDLPLLARSAAMVPVGLSLSVAIDDHQLQQSVEPGTPSTKARLDLIRAIRDAGLSCGVLVAPVLPGLTDSVEHLDSLFGQLAEAGAATATVIPLHLRPGTREWYMGWLAREHPELVGLYRRLYGRGSYAGKDYRTWLSARVRPLLAKHGLRRRASAAEEPAASDPVDESRQREAKPAALTLF
jgi:DNA repair photolyase